MPLQEGPWTSHRLLVLSAPQALTGLTEVSCPPVSLGVALRPGCSHGSQTALVQPVVCCVGMVHIRHPLPPPTIATVYTCAPSSRVTLFHIGQNPSKQHDSSFSSGFHARHPKFSKTPRILLEQTGQMLLFPCRGYSTLQSAFPWGWALPGH